MNAHFSHSSAVRLRQKRYFANRSDGFCSILSDLFETMTRFLELQGNFSGGHKKIYDS